MLTEPVQLWELLRSLDDPDHLEFPADYHHRRERARFEQLAQRLDTDFACWCVVDRHVEDASLHGRIDIPALATATGLPLVILVSNFGGLAVLAVENPGVWTDAEAAQLLHATDVHRIEIALGHIGYTLIPEEPLWRDYDGAAVRVGIARSIDTWWTRYFDYL